MNLEQVERIVQANDLDKFISLLESNSIVNRLSGINDTVTAVSEALKQYSPATHDIHDITIRKDKPIKNEAGEIADYKKVWRLSLALQKKIVNTAVAFLGTPTLHSDPQDDKQKDLVAIIEKIREDNKLKYKFKQLAKKVMSEKHAAIIWYSKPLAKDNSDYWDGYPIQPKAGNEVKLSMKILCESNGDELFPVFDEYDDMVAFGRRYNIKDEDNKEIVHFDLYTANRIYMAKRVNGQWLRSTDGVNYSFDALGGMDNKIGKIPVIYYCQPLTEWEDVQPLIHRLEVKISNLADTNDYFDSPMVVATDADAVSMPDKGEQGKLIEVRGPNGDIKYLTWDQAPESMKLEIELLKGFIHSLTQTPDISFENLKQLGYFSTVALQTMFMDAHFKAADKEEIFGEGEQRSINYLKKAISVIDESFKPALKLKIEPRFKYFLPENIQELVTTLTTAVTGKIMTTETAVQNNPLVKDKQAEIEALKEAAVVLPQPIQQGQQGSAAA